MKISVNGEEHAVEVADSILERVKGLSFRSEGKMLFRFPRDVSAKIDMMLLSKPLHLYFMNSDKQVIDVQRAEPWTWNPRTWKLYSPSKKYRYLLESFEDLGIEDGDRIQF